MAVQETDGKQTAMRIDMNSDMGESFGRWTLGDDEALLDVVSSANVACGFHAGDPSVMLRTLSYAASRGVMSGRMWRTATWPDSGAAMWTSSPTSSRRT